MSKLAILGGGGVRMPALVHELLQRGDAGFDQIALLEPNELRREVIGRLATELAQSLVRPDAVTVTADVEEAITGSDFIFSAVRVGGDRGRVIDETVALAHGLVGQETIGPGGFAMAMRTIPVVLDYCRAIERLAPDAVLINFTNPAGIITQAILSQTRVRAVGVCDTPSSTVERISSFVGPNRDQFAYQYGGLNHLGWVTSVTVDGQERIPDLLARYEELSRFDHAFRGFDPELVRKVGAIPTEYLYYYYYPRRYVDTVRRAGHTRGENVEQLNRQLLSDVAPALRDGDFTAAWAAYARLMDLRHDSYMRLEMDGERTTTAAGGAAQHGTDDGVTRHRTGDAAAQPGIGGYERIAIAVMDSIAAGTRAEVIVNTRNGSTLGFLDPDDIVEAPARIDADGMRPRAPSELPDAARSLVLEVKEYERAVVEAAAGASAERAAKALALHPLVPDATVAGELLRDYREAHGADLGYLR